MPKYSEITQDTCVIAVINGGAIYLFIYLMTEESCLCQPADIFP